MKDVAFKKWLEEYAGSDEGSRMPDDGEALLWQYVRDGLDYEKYDLNPQQVLFAIYYVFHTGNNAKKAARLAGYPSAYCNTAGSWVRGKNAKPDLQAFIADLVTGFGASPTQIVGFLTQVMTNDFYDVAIDFKRDQATGEVVRDEFGQPEWFYNLEKVKEYGLTPMIKSIKRVRGEIQAIELHDPMKAAELLGQTHAMFKKHVEINNLRDAIQDAGISEAEAQAIKNGLKEKAKQQLREKRLSQERSA